MLNDDVKWNKFHISLSYNTELIEYTKDSKELNPNLLPKNLVWSPGLGLGSPCFMVEVKNS